MNKLYKVISKYDMIQNSVQNVNKNAIYISNNMEYRSDIEQHIWDLVIERIKIFCNIKPFDCEEEKIEYFQNILSNVLEGGLFVFDDMEQLNQFKKIFFERPVYASAIFAVEYDKNGNMLDTNT